MSEKSTAFDNDRKVKHREYMREYQQRPEVKERQREYRQRPEVRQRLRDYNREYQRRRRASAKEAEA